ncbi:MAG: CDP-2,3-bis-(O-geranylgeranyl)-sn-glycerol synthase [Candidatus Lokiarchaeota archaeon]|nr:CDP-2,3-bis-(O-geranylgeranyl)-sn-glycerol synthase [Candidatus Lokiarchaeota archaeon]MBD3338420.1 CDP-2,3-bis-(O-geranylgeranyl)-sn-glycerol synthase [Candidatus Lokiarchaeota archaeon]
MRPQADQKRKADERNKKIAYRLAILFGVLFFLDFIITIIFYTASDWLAVFVFSLLLIVPGYISNAGMVLVGGGKPIDSGHNFFDGRRIFGDHKTWKGFLLGPLLVGIPICLGVFLLFFILAFPIMQIPIEAIQEGEYRYYNHIYYYEYYFLGGPYYRYYALGGFYGISVIIIRIFFAAYGAAFGDLVGSFLKRRINIKSGEPFWIIDQLDFAVFSLIFVCIPTLIFPDLFLLPDLNIVIFIFILTPSTSIIANTVAYYLNLKDVPW